MATSGGDGTGVHIKIVKRTQPEEAYILVGGKYFLGMGPNSDARYLEILTRLVGELRSVGGNMSKADARALIAEWQGPKP